MPNNLEQKVDKILTVVLSNQEKIKILEQGMHTVKTSNEEILTTMDAFAKKVEKIEEEQTANLAAHDRFEGRITTLETQRAAA